MDVDRIALSQAGVVVVVAVVVLLAVVVVMVVEVVVAVEAEVMVVFAHLVLIVVSGFPFVLVVAAVFLADFAVDAAAVVCNLR